jgi:hypothetical protein
MEKNANRTISKSQKVMKQNSRIQILGKTSIANEHFYEMCAKGSPEKHFRGQSVKK